MGARNLFSSSSSGPADVDHLQRPRTSAGAAEASPTKSRFSRLRYRRNREKTEPDVAEPQQQRRQTTLEQLPEGAFLDFDDDAAEPESRPSTSSSVASSVKSSGGWSWSMRSRRSSGGLRERWRASSISSSSSSLSSASSYVSSSSSSTSSTWSSLESTPRASIASSRTSYSSDDEDIRPPKETPGTTRPTKTVRAYVCRHFVSIPIPEEEPEDIQNSQQSQQAQLPPTPSPDENEGCMTDPMADAFDLDAHLPPPHILRPWVEPTPPPTPPLQQKQLQPPSSPPTEHLSVPQSPPPAQGVPTFILTPASPIQPSSPSPFSSSPPSAAIARRSFSAPVTSNPSTVPTTGLRRRSTSNASSSRQKVEKGTPAHCPTCVRLQESMAHMRKVAGIYGPRHSLTVAAAKNARAARVAWAEAQWEASCADDGPDDAAVKSRKEGLTAEQGKKQKKSVSIQPGATFFVDREPFVQGPPSTSAGDDAEEEEAIDIEAQLQREMIIGQRLWGPLGERGRKQREFKRSLSESYVPGRWAVAAGNEWLDTSGRTQTYEEFWEGKTKGKDGGSVLLGGKVIRGVLGKMVPGAGHAKRERERAERLERGMGLDVD
ncbi:hypothetical protein DIS24_g9453 [Lasiodiplodia hormozganensis]|uniref:Uncharacterized protein n=1 Tax=Lasiodiplodia hormozganensis TaxID=869390 RepID=A0AA39XVF3_9PEZI|nr:hypothetical protein DIS24_g9453 [Lasiodiplodia hormozganensis]